MHEFGSFDLRPHQLMSIVSKIGEGHKGDLGNSQLTEILNSIRKKSSLPITLRCPVISNYDYQNPAEMGESSLFHIRCDLKILQRMGMVPGDTRPAIEIFERLLETVENAEGILYFDKISSSIWNGLDIEGRNYNKGHAMGLQAIIPNCGKNKKKQIKTDSVKVMYGSEKLKIRPHHLMCMTCFYGGQEFKPIDEDNLFEAINIIHSNPDVLVELVCGPCMICPPCHFYCQSSKQCVSPNGMALRDELKDLDVLQILGLKYGDVIPAEELFTNLYRKVDSTIQICGFGDGKVRSPEWSICGGNSKGDNSAYAKARGEGLGFLDTF